MPATSPITDQIAQEKLDARKWYTEHKSELPAVGFRGMGTDLYAAYLRKAYAKTKDSPLKLSRASFGGQDDSPESVLSSLLHDAGTGGSLVASDPQDRITNAAEYNLSQRDDTSTETVQTREDVIARLVSRFGECLTCYFRHVIDREKCRDIAPTIMIYGRSGVRTWKPAIIKRQALAVEKWVLALPLPLEEKARFLAELRQAVEAERREIAWRVLAEPNAPLPDRWAQLFAAVERPKLWWERRRPEIPTDPQKPDWYELVLPAMAGKRSQRWVLLAAPILGREEPDPDLPVSKAKELAGGNHWQRIPQPVTSNYLQSFGLMSVGPDSPVLNFMRSQISKRPVFHAADFPELPPFCDKPDARYVPKPEPEPTRKEQREDRKKAKAKILERGLDVVLASDDYTRKEKVQFEDIVNHRAEPRRELARRLRMSPATLTNKLATLKKLGAKVA